VNRRVFIALLLAIAARVGAEDPAAFHVGTGLKVRLVSDVTAIQPGQPFTVGLWLQHEPGYHTYWRSPGLAGVPTGLAWTLPDGFQVGPLSWPAPAKVKMASINTHGYEDDTLLFCTITPPAVIDGETVVLKTKASWMCCGRTCHPGFADLSLSLPLIGKASAPAWDVAWHDAFAAARAAVPPPLEGWTLRATRHDKSVRLVARPPQGTSTPDAPQFFSSDNLICSHPAQVWVKEGDALVATLPLSDLPPKDAPALRGLLWAKSPWMKSATCVEIEVPFSVSEP
jgi:DsbC/DsbD-like thiol-disulfide interchange protein